MLPSPALSSLGLPALLVFIYCSNSILIPLIYFLSLYASLVAQSYSEYYGNLLLATTSSPIPLLDQHDLLYSMLPFLPYPFLPDLCLCLLGLVLATLLYLQQLNKQNLVSTCLQFMKTHATILYIRAACILLTVSSRPSDRCIIEHRYDVSKLEKLKFGNVPPFLVTPLWYQGKQESSVYNNVGCFDLMISGHVSLSVLLSLFLFRHMDAYFLTNSIHNKEMYQLSRGVVVTIATISCLVNVIVRDHSSSECFLAIVLTVLLFYHPFLNTQSSSSKAK